VLATLFGTAIGTICTAEHQIQPLLTQAEYHIKPTETRISTLAQLTAHASAHGINLTPKAKPAR